MGDCGFQTNAFQQNAFQMCVPVPPTPVSVAGYAGGQRYAYIPRKIPDDDEAIMIILLELLDD